MSNKRFQRYLSKKKSAPAPEGDKDFIGEMAKRINAQADAEQKKESRKSGHVDEQESDGSANAFATK
jgi:hypothetical protein